MSRLLQSAWYRKRVSLWLWPFLPLSGAFYLLSGMRRLAYRVGLKKQWKAPVPVVIVGNISVGGTGKTPLVLRLVEALKDAGLRPGIVSRGYGGKGPFPLAVSAQSSPTQAGDEPVMLAAVSQVPVVVAPKRAEAARFLLENFECDVLISDDGMQHYALGRDIEIAVVDASRGTGNGIVLPCGPLREPRSRLKKVTWTVVNGGERSSENSVPMYIKSAGWRSVSTNAEIEKPDGETVVAIAGIGNPQRFFNLLSQEGLSIEETRVFPDHHQYSATDFYNISNLYPLVMTEKDAVKCRSFARPHWYYLKVGAALPAAFITRFIEQIQELRDDT